jgi:NADPH:quinone reductase-like Zn-dependent oxidoreductase
VLFAIEDNMETQNTKKKMHAVRIHDYGKTDVLKYEEVDIPEPAPDEVLVKVNYSSVNPLDWKVRDGSAKNWIQLSMPAILGVDFAGTVEKVGDKVSKFRKGDKVYGRANFQKGGSYAEYVTVNEDSLGIAPKSISLKEAAGLPVAAGTAWNAIFDIANVKKGSRVLVTGASGGVGSMAVQLAKSAGAYVIGTTSKANIDMVKSLGADEVIDYTEGDFTKKVSEPVDVVFDTVGKDPIEKSYGIIKKGGMFVTTVGQPDEALAQKCGITAKGFSAQTNGKRYEEIAKLVDEGKLKVVIDREFPLTDVKSAHELSETMKTKGKIIIRVSSQ